MKLEFWFEFASTYSYPAAMRIDKVAATQGVEVEWRPFLLGPIFKAQQGLDDSPFNAVPEKGAYMWRDLERICEARGLPFQRPSRFPRNGLPAARATLALPNDRRPSFVKAVFQANFVHDRDIADPAIIHAALRRAGVEPFEIEERIDDSDIKDQLRADTAAAAARGIFGSPTFFTEDGEMFWGDDRLDQAIDWAAHIAAVQH
ncbi:2-hydroxychromene-2-carboxylate isomerase [bacterium]|nr:2-hydroxychromene-2-carboxylate isomerase [bacterium]